MSPQTRNGATAVIGTLGLFCAVNVVLILNPVLAFVGSETYPDLDFATVTYLSTAVSLSVGVVTLISGAIAGKLVRYKTLAVIGLTLVAIAGIIPYFVSDFAVVLGTRVLVGIGAGLVQPLGNTVALKLFEGERATQVQGWGSIVSNGTGIIFQLIATSIVLMNVDLVWLIHAVMIIPALLVLFLMPEPEPDNADETVVVDRSRAKLTFPVYFISIAFAVIFMVYYPLLLNVSAIVTTENLGSATDIAIIGSLYTVGGMVAGAVYSKIYNSTGKMFFPVTFGVWILGMALFAFGGSVPILTIGAFMTGMGVFFVWPGSIAWLEKRIAPEALSPASGLFAALFQFAAFLSTPYTSLIGNVFGSADPRLPLIVGTVVMIVVALIWIAYTMKNDGVRYQAPESTPNAGE